MDTEHENLQRLFGAAVDDAGLDGDVMPGVLAGYDRRVRARRFQAAGGTLAVLAVAAGAVALAPHGGGDAEQSVGPVASSPAPDFVNSGCHQHWNTADQVRSPAGLNDEAGAVCQVLSDSLHAVVPDARVLPQIFPDLWHDPRIDQQQLKAYYTAIETTHQDPPQSMLEFAKKVQAEKDYLKAHPEDPTNIANGGAFDLVSPAGRQDLRVRLWPGKPLADQVPTECAVEPSDYKKDADCIPISVTGGWHGTITRYPQPQQMFFLGAMLTDDRGHYIELDSFAQDETRNLSAPVTNATAKPALTPEQFKQWFSAPGFQLFLDAYLKYALQLPPVGPFGSPITPTPSH